MLSGNCLDTVILPFVTLNCSNSEVSNLQECGVMEVEDCSCPTSHARISCNKGIVLHS